MEVNVLIADDHALVRQGVMEIIRQAFPSARFTECASAQEVLDQVWRGGWDVVILDLSMPGRSGLETLCEIKKTAPELPVLILSMHPEDQFAVRLLKAGAAGYVTKSCTSSELLVALRKVMDGGRYITLPVAEILANHLRKEPPGLPHENLSDREFEVLLAIAAGKTVGDIAREFSLSVKTISTHRTRILRKMAMHSNAQLTHYAIRSRLIEEVV
jgi:two-component system, NarL family, invasion response regulator UvrY